VNCPKIIIALRTLLSLFLLFSVAGLDAQIAAPDFICTRTQSGAEVLTWENTPNGCGPFVATEVYVATAAAGPFTLLTAISDPAVTSFQDPNPGGELRFYYLSYRYDCPGEVALNSDTLDNLIPLTPNILFVGVEGNELVVEWEASTSPEVSGYIILEQTPTANVPVDTVFGDTSFRLELQPGDPPPGERSFLLVAIDPCENDSPQGRVASAMDLEGSGGLACTETITLSVDQAAIAQYFPPTGLELFVSVNGDAFTSAGTFAPDAATVTYAAANDGEELCFYLEAVLPNNLGRARSVEYCQTVAFNQPVRNFPLFGAEINTAGETILQFGTGVVQPMNLTASLLVTRANGQTGVLDLPGFMFTGGVTVIPPLAEPIVEGDLLRLRLVDDCMREVTTNRVAPIFLTGISILPGRNTLNWTAFINELNGPFTYAVDRAFVTDPAAAAGAMFTEIAAGLTETTLTDNVVGEEDIACYQVSASYRPEDGGPDLVFRSNIVCVLPRTEVFIPNAFSPNAVQSDNLTFRPRFSNLPPADGYSLSIYDRWGGLLFTTEDPSAGWAGDSQGQFLPAGTYLYQLSFRNSFGETVDRAGTVNLLR